MVNDGDPPPLPETEDPYELLGVARDADPPTVKKAYARLLRVYRPDKSPREFQRVHQAFEIIRARGSEAVPFSAPPIVVTQPTIDDGALATRISARVAEAGESFEARCALIDALLAEKAPLDLVFAHEVLRDAALRHRTLSWVRLAEASSDLRAAHAVWVQIWHYAFEHDRQRAVALLDDDRLRRDAGDHPHLAIACIDRIAALNWLHSFDERRLVRMLREACPPGHRWVDHALDAIELDFAGASAIRQRDWPAPLHAFVKLAIASRVDGERCGPLARELMAALTADVGSTLAAFDALCREISLEPFFELIYEALPADYVRLDALPKERFDRLTEVLASAGSSPLTWKIRGGVAAGAAALAVISWIPSAILAGGALTYGLATEGLRYKQQIRPRLVQAIRDVPVVSALTSRWITLNRKFAGRLTRYTPAIDNDTALFAFSMLLCYADTFVSANNALDGDLTA